MRLQMAGLLSPDATRLLRSGANPDSFSILHYVDRRLVCVESANAPVDHNDGRQNSGNGQKPPAEQSIDPKVPLKSFV